MLGPDYQRPDVPAPAVFRGEEGKAQAESIADANWATVANDPVLQELISTAIANNLDLRIAMARVTEARARYGIVRSFHVPGGGGNWRLFVSNRIRSWLTRPMPGARTAATLTGTPAYRSPGSSTCSGVSGGRARRPSPRTWPPSRASERYWSPWSVTWLPLPPDAPVGPAAGDCPANLVTNEETVRFYRTGWRVGFPTGWSSTPHRQPGTHRDLVPQFERQIAVTENALSLLLGRPLGPSSVAKR